MSPQFGFLSQSTPQPPSTLCHCQPGRELQEVGEIGESARVLTSLCPQQGSVAAGPLAEEHGALGHTHSRGVNADGSEELALGLFCNGSAER